MKKKLIIIGILLLIVAMVGFLVVKMMYKKAERNLENENAIVVNNIELVKAYQANEANANTLYLNKTIEVSGIVSIVEKTENQTSVTLSTADSLPKVIAIFSSSQNILVNDSVVLKGICTGFLSNVLINNAILVSSKKAAIPNVQLHNTDTTKKIITTIKKDTVAVKKIFKTNKAQITFDAGGGVEDIKATNNQAEASIDINGNISFKVAMLQFKFADVLMQQHFNEDYVESSKFPTATFIGKIENDATENLTTDGIYKANVKGNLTLHGITKSIQTVATLQVKNQKISTNATIKIILENYGVKAAAADEATINIMANF
jgi:polyisoprenoid-binding protein YceI